MHQGRLLGGLHESTDGGGPVDEVVSAERDGRSATIYDLQPDPQARVNLRRLPRLARNAMRILWRAARRDFLLSTGMQLIGGLGITVQLLLEQWALQALLGATRGGGSVADVLPWAVAVALVAALLFFATAVQRERQQIVGELVSRHIEERVLDVAAAVGLGASSRRRSTTGSSGSRTASHQPLNLVFGLSAWRGRWSAWRGW
jgi:ATP-binding cassette subfamily B protein